MMDIWQQEVNMRSSPYAAADHMTNVLLEFPLCLFYTYVSALSARQPLQL